LTFEELLTFCLIKPGAWRDEPWDGDVVAKVDQKIFAFLGDSKGDGAVGVKLGDGRDEADTWLAQYPDDARVMSYIGRSGWNTLLFNGSIPDEEILAAVDESYLRVVEKLAKKRRPEGWDSSGT
jgi:predicted DNA-binding protein (MmcQ/YjbR family)